MQESKYIHKSHNVSVLLYHFVCLAKYRRAVFDERVDKGVKDICLEISKRYQILFLEIGTDNNHVHFLLQSVPTYSCSKIITIIKSITAKQIFKTFPEIKKDLWGGELWSDGYYVATIGEAGNWDIVIKYINKQGKKPEDINLRLFNL